MEREKPENEEKEEEERSGRKVGPGLNDRKQTSAKRTDAPATVE